VSSNKQTPETNGSGPVDPAPRPTRRSFTAEYKTAVVAEYEAAAHGEKSAGQTRERRRQAIHPAKVKPELVADGPSQVWSYQLPAGSPPPAGIAAAPTGSDAPLAGGYRFESRRDHPDVRPQVLRIDDTHLSL
jgi:hypothetical protein